MNHYTLVLTRSTLAWIVLLFAATAALGLAAGVAVTASSITPAKAKPTPPAFTVCHKGTQTNCLWIDGHAEWR